MEGDKIVEYGELVASLKQIELILKELLYREILHHSKTVDDAKAEFKEASNKILTNWNKFYQTLPSAEQSPDQK